METKINIISPSEHELEVTLAYEEIQSDLEKAFEKERKKIEMPGFRKGKVPVGMIRKVYGDSIEVNAAENIANRKFWDIADEQNLEPIGAPSMTKFDLDKEKGLSFTIRYEVKPEMELKDYKGQEFTKVVFKVDDELLDAEIQNLLDANRTLEDAEIVEDKNYEINVDLQSVDKEGNPVENSHVENTTINLSDKRIFSHIIDKAIGKKVGDKFTFSSNENSVNEALEEGTPEKEENIYEVTIKGIKKIVLPEANEEFVKKVTKDKFSSIEELKNNIREDYQKYFDDQSESILEDGILSKIIDNNPFTPPHSYVHLILDRLVEDEKEKAKQNGNKRFDEHEAHHRLHDKAETVAKWRIISENLARIENIKVEDSELEEQAAKDAEATGISVDRLIAYYKQSGRAAQILERKIIDFLKKNNNIKEVNSKDLKKENEGK